MGNKSAWSDPSAASDEDIARMAAHLEDRASRPDQWQVNQDVRAAMAPRPGERLLEVGSGSGVLMRLMAPDVGKRGLVTGVDFSHRFVKFAAQKALKTPVSKTARFLTSHAQSLPFTDNSFDGVFAARLLLHAKAPLKVVLEMTRVARPGGRIVLMDWDFETVTVDHPDRELTRRLLHWRNDNHGGDNWSGRKLCRYGRAAGLSGIEIRPVTVIAKDENAALTLSLWRSAEVAHNAGAVSAQEYDGWIADLKARIAEGTFFASLTYFIVKGWKSN